MPRRSFQYIIGIDSRNPVIGRTKKAENIKSGKPYLTGSEESQESQKTSELAGPTS